MKPQKVAIFTHGIRGGPFARLSTTLAKGFQELGVNCDVVILDTKEQEKEQYPNLNIVSLSSKRAIFSLFPLISYLRVAKPDVIFSMPWYFNVLALIARKLSLSKTKIIIGEHNICSLESTIEHGNKLNIKLLPHLMRWSYPYGDGLIGVSQDTITDLIKEIKISQQIPMKVIPNPIDGKNIRQQATIAGDWENIPTVLTVARLAKQKQLDVLIKAFAQVIKKTPAKLIILGEGYLRTELENLCQQLHIEQFVVMAGYDPNPYRYMKQCDVFVLASAWEGCPIALEEAMACGAATIVTDAPGGAKEMVGNGKYGMVIPTGDIDALAAKILNLLTDTQLKQHYQHQAQIRSLDFQYLNICQQYLDFSQSLDYSVFKY